jgi:hypothetical protein
MNVNVSQGRNTTVRVTNVSAEAERLGLPPRVISDLFYARKLDTKRCPIIGGRRLIPVEYRAELEATLHQLGIIPALVGADDR